jgi:hypothetical protein
MKAARARGIEFLGRGEPNYPARLQMIDDAPPLLATRGKLAALARPLVAIVGSRNASAAGVKFAERLARELGEAGFGIVSASRAVLTPPPIAPALRPGPLPCWPAVTTAFIRPNTPVSWNRSSPMARRYPKCRSPGNRVRTTSPAATG